MVVGPRIPRECGGICETVRRVCSFFMRKYTFNLFIQLRFRDLSSTQELCSRSGIYGLRLPLQLALAVSPISLLAPVHLHKVSCDGRICDQLRPLSGQIWQGLGSPRPPTLVAIERVLWEVIFEIAKVSKVGTTSRLIKAFQEIEAMLEEGPDPALVGWFHYDGQLVGDLDLYSVSTKLYR